MKQLFLFLMGCSLPFFMTGQDKPDDAYSMWEMIYLTPDNTKLQELSASMKKHNQTYHTQGPFSATVYNVTTGPNTGKMIWMMGPCTFSDLDNRPSEGGHDTDWRDNIMPYVKKVSNGEFWKFDAKLSNMPDPSESADPFKIVKVRYLEVAQGQGYRVQGLLEKISKTVKSLDGDHPWGVFYNEFAQGVNNGRHLAITSFYNKWAELDRENKFKVTYLKVHGENTWDGFIREIGEVFSNNWQELSTYAPGMSGQAEQTTAND